MGKSRTIIDKDRVEIYCKIGKAKKGSASVTLIVFNNTA